MADDTPVLIPLRSNKYPGLYAIVDAEDAPLVLSFRWRVAKDHNTFYAYRVVPHYKRDNLPCAQAMHRFVLNAKKGTMIDHRNRNGLDNRKSNLRYTTNLLNQGNSCLRKNASGYRGVRKQGSRWSAYIRRDGKVARLGMFDSPIDAAKAYDEAARNKYGEFATTNFGE